MATILPFVVFVVACVGLYGIAQLLTWPHPTLPETRMLPSESGTRWIPTTPLPGSVRNWFSGFCKRVLVWRRGNDEQSPLVVMANFSDFVSEGGITSGEYRVPNWPATPPGKRWHEITQDRLVDPAWVGREPVFPWEAKVYTLV